MAAGTNKLALIVKVPIASVPIEDPFQPEFAGGSIQFVAMPLSDPIR
jgi:hypothetical protein